jgi:hypothetical protein
MVQIAYSLLCRKTRTKFLDFLLPMVAFTHNVPIGLIWAGLGHGVLRAKVELVCFSFVWGSDFSQSSVAPAEWKAVHSMTWHSGHVQFAGAAALRGMEMIQMKLHWDLLHS